MNTTPAEVTIEPRNSMLKVLNQSLPIVFIFLNARIIFVVQYTAENGIPV